MTVYPEVQRKAQEEIDRVVGQDRLPTMTDRENLPYIEAMVKEVLRWHPVAPMALPHTSIDSDVCEGYFIPKGSMLLANVWLVYLVAAQPLVRFLTNIVLGISHMIRTFTKIPWLSSQNAF